MSKVRYIDYENDVWFHPTEYPHWQYNLCTPIIHKRNEFKEENEFRLFHRVEEIIVDRNKNHWGVEEENRGLLIPVNLKSLVQRIVLHPSIDKKAKEKIKKLVTSNNQSFIIEKFSISNQPYF